MRINRINLWANIFTLTVLLIILNALNLHAQSSTNVVKGVVQNNNNEPLPGVSVVIRNLKTNFTSGTSTDSLGGFTFSRISSGGPYSFTFSTVGYESQTLSGYHIKEDNSFF